MSNIFDDAEGLSKELYKVDKKEIVEFLKNYVEQILEIANIIRSIGKVLREQLKKGHYDYMLLNIEDLPKIWERLLTLTKQAKQNLKALLLSST